MVENSLAKQVEKKTFSSFISSDLVKKKINEVVGGKDGQRFITAITSAVSANPTLAECEHWSIFSSAMIGESLKLSPSPQLGQYFLVPYNDNKTGKKVAQFQIGYKGYIQLAIRSGNYKKINILAIKEGELKKWNPLTEEIDIELIEDDEKREAAPTIGYYAMFEYLNGFQKVLYWSRKKMEIHAHKYSAAYRKDKEKHWSNSFWTKDFDSQALKTMIRQLISKWGILSIDTVMQKALESDDMTSEIDIPESTSTQAASEDFFSTTQAIDVPAEPTPEVVKPEVVKTEPVQGTLINNGGKK